MGEYDSQSQESGRGKASAVPAEIRGWNWGAFLLSWIWGIGNSTYIALLMFVPFVNLVMPFVLGAKGSEWAWKNRVWRDVEHFRKTQRKWAWAGLFVVVVFVPSCVAIPMTAMKHSEAYRLSLDEIRGDARVKDALGEPVETGLFVMGSIQTSGPDGRAAIEYSVEGPKAEGTAYVYAVKDAGAWELSRVYVDVPGPGEMIPVVGIPER